MAKPDMQPNTVSPPLEALLSGPDNPDIKRRLLELQERRMAAELALLEKQSAVADITLRKSREEEGKKEEQARQDRVIQEEGAKNSLRSLTMERHIQQRCSHLHPDSGKSTLVGVRHWDQTITLNCAICKLNDTDTQANLIRRHGVQSFPKQDMIGGVMAPGSYISGGAIVGGQ